MAIEKGKMPSRTLQSRSSSQKQNERLARNGLNIVCDDNDARSRGGESAVHKKKPHGDLLPGVSTARLEGIDQLVSGEAIDMRMPTRGFGPMGLNAAAVGGGIGRAPSFSARAIFGRDDRTPVRDTGIAPYCWICDLEIISPSGVHLVGTGWLAGPRLVITAGHCVYSQESQYGIGWMKKGKMQVLPGRNGETVLASAGVERLMTTREWIDNASEEFDIGAILLDSPLGDDLGFFGFADYDDSDFESMVVNIAGYPADKGGDDMWQHANRIERVLPQRLGYTIDTLGGDSGAPLVYANSGRFIVVGVHNYGTSSSNYATRINTAVFDQIVSWKDL